MADSSTALEFVVPEVHYLEDDDLGRLDLTMDNGYLVTELDLGWPAVRAVTNNRSQANGADDLTRLYGPRAVTMTVGCFAPEDGPNEGVLSRREVMRRLRAYESPGRRPVLVFAEDDGVLQRVRLRGDTVTPPSRLPIGQSVTIQLGWVAPEGIIEDDELLTVPVSAVADFGGGGRTYPKRYPLKYAAYRSTGAAVVINGGEPAAPIYRMWGPVTNPILRNVESGSAVVFDGGSIGDLVLTADQYAEVDVREATAYLNGRTSENLYNRLSSTQNVFAWLRPGRNRLRYSGANLGPGAHVDVLYRRANL